MPDSQVQIADYCRQIETYLCQKNDGHLIRIVGPSFDLVSRWAADCVPLKVAFSGIDRYFERYYRNRPRRRPVRIDFCEADVLDVFDEWRRAIGLRLTAAQPDSSLFGAVAEHPPRSLPAHLERAVAGLTNARAKGSLSAAADDLIDRMSCDLDAARARPGGIRGEARRALIERLAAFDAELLAIARATLDEPLRAVFEKEAEQELAGFRDTMAADHYQRARQAAIDRLIRDRFGLPMLAFP